MLVVDQLPHAFQVPAPQSKVRVRCWLCTPNCPTGQATVCVVDSGAGHGVQAPTGAVAGAHADQPVCVQHVGDAAPACTALRVCVKPPYSPAGHVPACDSVTTGSGPQAATAAALGEA